MTVDPSLSGLDLFFEASAVPSMLIDLGRRQILRVNAAALSELGLPADAVLGRAGRDFLSEPSEDQVLRLRGLRGESTLLVRQVRTASGPRLVELNVVPTGVGDVAFVQAIDLTDLLDAVASAETQVEELRRKSDALAAIAVRLAHDLRSPLAVIGGFASLLRDRGDRLAPEQAVDMLDRIVKSAHALGSLTDTILEDAQVRAEMVSPTSYEVESLFEVIRGATAAQVADASAELAFQSDVERLPVPVGSLAQPVFNLVSNAMKYRSPDRALRVELGVRSDGRGGVVVEVSDNGRGLGDDPGSLFDPGVRGASATGTTGTGLGLSFVKAAVESIGGTVSASDRGQGAVFRIAIPPLADPRAEARPDTSLSAAQLRRILDVSPVPTVVIDLEHRRIVRASKAMVALLGLPRESIVGRPGRDFLEEADVADALRDAALAAPGTFSSSRVGVWTTRGVVPAWVSLAMVPDSVLAVAQVVPLVPDQMVAMPTATDTATAMAAMAAAAVTRASELGVDGLVDVLSRIERLAREAR